jgi:hypothetical protein
MSRRIQKEVQKEKQRSYLNKDFDAFKAELLSYVKTYFPDKISDFSDASVGSMFLEMAAYVGDVMSFYLDHQFNELDVLTAVESRNVERLVRQSGVKIRGSAPALVDVDFYIEVPTEEVSVNGVLTVFPRNSYLPVIKQGSTLSSKSGITFELTEDVNFSLKDENDNYVASFSAAETNSDGEVTSVIGKMSGLCTSGKLITESFSIADNIVPFRKITLSSENVTDIMSVKDSAGNEYYEVDALTQDTVFSKVANIDSDSVTVPDNIQLIPAPRRFITSTSTRTRLTTLRFGSGDGATLDNDIIPDPSEVSLPLFGDKKTFSRAAIDPNSLLNTRTLGISPRNTMITVRYRAGGGLRHNVGPGQINSITSLTTEFGQGVPPSVAAQIRASTQGSNPLAAAGGESALNESELRVAAVAYRNSQSRIVTKDDLVARIYTMPSNFGRVFRVGIRANPNNPLASMVSIVSRDSSGHLAHSPDALKENIKTYINEFRLVSDAIDIVDAQIINFGVIYSIIVDATSNKNLVIQSINSKLKRYLDNENFQIDQPIVKSDFTNLILNTDGVVSLIEIEVVNKTGVEDEKAYSDVSYNVESNTQSGIVFPPAGGIFELKFPLDDIIGSAE